MTSASSSPPKPHAEPRPGGPGGLLSLKLRCWGLAGLVLTVFLLGYGATLALVLHQAAFATSPGDRLLVAFAPGTGTPAVVEQLGAAGAVHHGAAGMPGFHQAEIIDAGAAENLSRVAWVMRVPGRPALASCFNIDLSAQRRDRS